LKIKLNPELIIDDMDDGKVIIEPQSGEGIFLDNESYSLLKSVEGNFVELRSIYSPEYDLKEFKEFIDELLSVKVLLTIK
jgi:hypothetical protein